MYTVLLYERKFDKTICCVLPLDVYGNQTPLKVVGVVEYLAKTIAILGLTYSLNA